MGVWWPVGGGQSKCDAVVVPHEVDVPFRQVLQPLAHRGGPWGVDPGTQGTQEANSPIADLVGVSLQDNGFDRWEQPRLLAGRPGTPSGCPLLFDPDPAGAPRFAGLRPWASQEGWPPRLRWLGRIPPVALVDRPAKTEAARVRQGPGSPAPGRGRSLRCARKCSPG